VRNLAVFCDRVGDTGGAERYWETVLPALAAVGVSVSLFAREVAGNNGFGVAARAIAWGDETQAPAAEAARAVAEVLRDCRPDAIVTASVFDTGVLDAVRAAPARWLARIHDHRPFCPTGDRVYPQFSATCCAPMGRACRAATVTRGCVRGPRPSSFREIAARETVRDRIARADCVLVSSEYMRATCAANGIDRARVAITPPPLPDAAFASAVHAPPEKPTLLFASRPTPRKGLGSLLRALGRLPPPERPRLIVAGATAADDESSRALAEQYGIEVDWRGHLGAHELRAAIDAASAVAVPSLWPEPFGLIGIEAQARGRPAVAYHVGGIPEWIGDAGIAVRRGDEAALAAAIRAVLDRGAWPRYAAAARRRAEDYHLNAHLSLLLELCNAA
jgi:glycosyltransferase involved in cell wall biosynthesis